MQFDNMMIVTFLCLCLFGSVKLVEHSKAAEGYPAGFLSDCPGSWKPAAIKPKSLEKLYIAVMGPGNVLQAKWRTYNYYHIRDLAKHPDIDFKKKTFLYVGGYPDALALPLGRTLGQVYRELGYNVLLFDYIAISTRDYPVAVRLTRPVGKHAAEMLANLTDLGLDPTKLELVGLSMGGQTMSFIAKNYREITGKNISSITALDPTGSCFRNLGPDQRLDASDADFVVKVATNIDGYGLATPVGHVNFYVNGGEYQPGDIWFLPCGGLCSHIRSYFLWLSALLNPGLFKGIQCNSVQQARDADCYDIKPMVTNTLDLYVDRGKPGIYYLSTFYRYPYGLGEKGLKRNGETILRGLSSLNEADMLWVK